MVGCELRGEPRPCLPLGPKLWSIAEACCQHSRGSLADSQRCQRRQCTILAIDVIRRQTASYGPPAAANLGARRKLAAVGVHREARDLAIVLQANIERKP